MLDYVELIKMVKTTYKLEDRAVIVGGGSYGGMLSAWLRLKYPQWFQGALAASAPILFFDGYVDPYAYDDIATDVFRKADMNCPISIKNGFEKLAEVDKNSYLDLKKIFNLCETPTSAADV